MLDSRAAFDALPLPFVALTASGDFALVNPAATTLLGPDCAPGSSLDALLEGAEHLAAALASMLADSGRISARGLRVLGPTGGGAGQTPCLSI